MRTNPPLRTAILAAALVVFLALPSLASAGQVVPPGNSAATQYTQVFPTSGGNVAVGTSIGESGGGAKQKPAQVIGKKTTQELESQGSEGRAVAQLAAESAPETAAEPEAGESAAAAGGKGGKGGSGGGGAAAGKAAEGNGNGAGSRAQGGARQAAPGGAGTATQADGGAAAAAGSGSSGLSEVLGQATGASSGQMGAFLPIILLAALVLALAYAWWRRQHPEHRAAP